MTSKIPGLLRPFAPISEIARLRLTPKLRVPGPGGLKYPMRFDGYQDMREINPKFIYPQWTASPHGIPGILSPSSTAYAPSLSQRGMKMPQMLDPDILQQLRQWASTSKMAAEIDPVAVQIRVHRIQKMMR